MKTLLLAVLFFAFQVRAIGEVTGPDPSQWTLQSPLPTQRGLNAMDYVNSNLGYVVGEYGTILKTNDGGNHWIPMNSGVTLEFNFVHFFDENTGIVAGPNGLLKTADGGTTWLLQNQDPLGHHLFFIDKNTGYFTRDSTSLSASLNIPSTYSKVYKTVDGGIHWSLSAVIPLATLSIQFLNTTVGYAAGQQVSGNIDSGYMTTSILMKTRDGGHSWETLYVGPNGGSLQSVQFLDTAKGFASELQWEDGVGYKCAFLKTQNAGKTWIKTQLETSKGASLYPQSIQFVTENAGYITEIDGLIWRTDNGGLTWSTVTEFASQNAYSRFQLQFTDAGSGYVLSNNSGANYLLKSLDSGNTWSPQSKEATTGSLFSVSFPSADTGYAVGNGYQILKTTNGGEDWLTQNNGMTPPSGPGFTFVGLTSIDVRGSAGYAVGGSIWTHPSASYDTETKGKIIKTVDGGNTWSIVNTGDRILTAVQIIDSMTVYAIGWKSRLGPDTASFLKSLDGGYTWFTVDIPMHSTGAMYFTNGKVGYIIGDDSLNVTKDGGDTWLRIAMPLDKKPTAIHFPNANTGYVVGEDGAIWKTSDAGLQWVRQNSGTTKNLTSVYFVDTERGYAVGNATYDDSANASNVLKTIDGGEHWITENLGSIANLNSIVCQKAGTCHAVGDYGVVYKAINPSVSVATRSGRKTANRYGFGKDGNPWYLLAYRSHVQAWLYDTRGRMVLKLLDTDWESGRHDLDLTPIKSYHGRFFLNIHTNDFHQSFPLQIQ
jgi:photosystem II stability/assembly factor-like uncharacterized protein